MPRLPLSPRSPLCSCAEYHRYAAPFRQLVKVVICCMKVPIRGGRGRGQQFQTAYTPPSFVAPSPTFQKMLLQHPNGLLSCDYALHFPSMTRGEERRTTNAPTFQLTAGNDVPTPPQLTPSTPILAPINSSVLSAG